MIQPPIWSTCLVTVARHLFPLAPYDRTPAHICISQILILILLLLHAPLQPFHQKPHLNTAKPVFAPIPCSSPSPSFIFLLHSHCRIHPIQSFRPPTPLSRPQHHARQTIARLQRIKHTQTITHKPWSSTSLPRGATVRSCSSSATSSTATAAIAAAAAATSSHSHNTSKPPHHPTTTVALVKTLPSPASPCGCNEAAARTWWSRLPCSSPPYLAMRLPLPRALALPPMRSERLIRRPLVGEFFLVFFFIRPGSSFLLSFSFHGPCTPKTTPFSSASSGFTRRSQRTRLAI